MSNTLNLCKALIARHSVTPDDAGCQDIMIDRLKKIGFTISKLRFGEVDNFWAVHGNSGPIFCFAGHTDVVPPGPLEQWNSDPFEASEQDGLLYGRGTADMKGSLAAMITATEAFVGLHPNHNGRIAFLITSDEEGDAIDGTAKVMSWLERENIYIDYCLVGEPSSSDKLGDVIKIGRRGSLSGNLKVIGKQGHVAYPQLADNPIHNASSALVELCTQTWDQGNEEFPPTSFQISNIQAGTGANNVIPGELDVMFNFRFSTETTEQQLRAQVETVLDKHQLQYKLDWHLSGNPFLTRDKKLINAVSSSIEAVMSYKTQSSTAGGTSDGRFIAPTGTEVVELGPLNRSIHKINECVAVNDLNNLSLIYVEIIKKLLT